VIDADGNMQISAESTVSVQAEKIFLGTVEETSRTGVIVGGGGILTILAALRNDLLGVPPGVPPSPAGVAALPLTTTALAALNLSLVQDPLLSSLASKTVFASS
jgi:hypothetical protein